MNKTFHLIDKLDSPTYGDILSDVSCGGVICTSQDISAAEQQRIFVLTHRGIAVYLGIDEDMVKTILDAITSDTLKLPSGGQYFVDTKLAGVYLERRTELLGWQSRIDIVSGKKTFGDSIVSLNYIAVPLEIFVPFNVPLTGNIGLYVTVYKGDSTTLAVREALISMFITEVENQLGVHFKDRIIILDDPDTIRETYMITFSSNIK